MNTKELLLKLRKKVSKEQIRYHNTLGERIIRWIDREIKKLPKVTWQTHLDERTRPAHSELALSKELFQQLKDLKGKPLSTETRREIRMRCIDALNSIKPQPIGGIMTPGGIPPKMAEAIIKQYEKDPDTKAVYENGAVNFYTRKLIPFHRGEVIGHFKNVRADKEGITFDIQPANTKGERFLRGVFSVQTSNFSDFGNSKRPRRKKK